MGVVQRPFSPATIVPPARYDLGETMRTDLIRLCLGIFLALFLGVAAPAVAQTAAPCPPAPHRGPFRVFDGLLFAEKPDLSRYGLEPIHIIDRDIWPDDNDRRGPPDPALVRRYVESRPNDGAPIVLDIENFDANAADPAVAAAAIAQLSRIHAVFASVAPNRSYGYYSMVPGRDYWRAIRGPGSPEYRAWQRENDRLAPLERRMDFLFPSLYAFYEDPRGGRPMPSPRFARRGEFRGSRSMSSSGSNIIQARSRPAGSSRPISGVSSWRRPADTRTGW